MPQPVAVRYAWADNPTGCNLYNGAGLPAAPALARLNARLRDFSADTQRDDIAMLLLRRTTETPAALPLAAPPAASLATSAPFGVS